MSSEHLATAAKLTDAPPSFKLLMFGLAYHADSHGRVRSSLGELIDTTGLSERSIRKWVGHGVKQGMLLQPAGQGYDLRLL